MRAKNMVMNTLLTKVYLTYLTLQVKITAIGGHNLSEYGLPAPCVVSEIEVPVVNVAELELYINQNEPLLNTEQRRIYDMVISGILI